MKIKIIGNKNGSHTEEKYSNYNVRMLVNKYNNKNICVKKTKYRQNGTISFITKYNEKGNIFKKTFYLENGNIDYIKEYSKYNGNLICETYYLASKNHLCRFFNRGKLDEESIYDPQGNLIRHIL